MDDSILTVPALREAAATIRGAFAEKAPVLLVTGRRAGRSTLMVALASKFKTVVVIDSNRDAVYADLLDHAGWEQFPAIDKRWHSARSFSLNTFVRGSDLMNPSTLVILNNADTWPYKPGRLAEELAKLPVNLLVAMGSVRQTPLDCFVPNLRTFSYATWELCPEFTLASFEQIVAGYNLTYAELICNGSRAKLYAHLGLTPPDPVPERDTRPATRPDPEITINLK